jgi:RHS repeat-associated protein
VNGVTQVHDAAGNLTSNGSTTWTYNARGRLVSAKLANATVYNYGINGLGQRVSKSGTAVSTGRQIYVYDEAGHLIGEYTNTGTPVWEHVYLGDLPVAVITSAGTVFPVLSDHLGTPRQVINASKQVRWKWDNTEPFGANAANQNPASLGVFAYNLRFPGQYFDAETGLHYNYFRDYNPQTGRYIESDPIGLSGGLNTFGYVGGNPISLIDPLGLSAWDDTITIPIPIPVPIPGTSGAGNSDSGGYVSDSRGRTERSAERPDRSTRSKEKECSPDKPDCRKASDWELKQAGIDPHEYKTEHGAEPWSRYDICKCKDGTFRIAQVGMCGKTNDYWW